MGFPYRAIAIGMLGLGERLPPTLHSAAWSGVPIGAFAGALADSLGASAVHSARRPDQCFGRRPDRRQRRGAQPLTAAARASARSATSQVTPGRSRPKCP